MFPGISGNSSFPQFGATPINFCSQELFGIVPRNFSKCSQEQFPGTVPDELWCINLGQGHSKGIVVLPEMSGLNVGDSLCEPQVNDPARKNGCTACVGHAGDGRLGSGPSHCINDT